MRAEWVGWSALKKIWQDAGRVAGREIEGRPEVVLRCPNGNLYLIPNRYTYEVILTGKLEVNQHARVMREYHTFATCQRLSSILCTVDGLCPNRADWSA